MSTVLRHVVAVVTGLFHNTLNVMHETDTSSMKAIHSIMGVFKIMFIFI